MELKYGYICDRGLNPRRPVNQDRALLLPEHGVFAVFDGVGGRQAGEIASQTAADTIEEALANASFEFSKSTSSPRASSTHSEEIIRRALEFANRDIYELATNKAGFEGMATTVALVALNRDKAIIAHVGDSRVYRLESDRLSQETIDHTDANDAMRAGQKAHRHPSEFDNGNVINRALGADSTVDVEIRTIKITEGTRFLLCSDGIYKHLSDDEIARHLLASRDPQESAESLKKRVFEEGADDNLTALIIHAGEVRTTKHTSLAGKAPALTSAGSRKQAYQSRINVEFGHQPAIQEQQTRSAVEGYLSLDDEAPQRGIATKIAIYGLIALIIAAAGFYAGLRASDWFRTRGSDARTATLAEQIRTGRSEIDNGEFAAALARLQGITQREPSNAEAIYLLGRAQLGSKQYKDAAASFERVIELQPSMRDAFLFGAAAYESDGNHEKAQRMLKRYGEERRTDTQ